MFKPIKPLYGVTFEMYSSNVHHRCVRGLVIPKILLRARYPTDRVSFPSREVHPHAWILGVSHRSSPLLEFFFSV
ncbi:hypothetical protein GW17_00033265 [Ensete ventricosum]|nr:hypothetical protein GW17_00033265 [Ensete ventricosum]